MMQMNICMKVDKDSVKPPPAVEETYRGVAAPSRPKVGNTAPIEEMPKVCLSTCQFLYAAPCYIAGCSC